ncbi:hypothetical protein Ae201684P_021315 [Aphanomyces euteiches]|uniref:Bulb-type lectin domain-containing protein n=1 Tax=Aphanomyces euteiches TaxID=100861 RepID=A0A6G0X7F3_9STRA|nr:hypothetical protein Ae201684_007780 [Aphanomyces euteiches]KAH9067149.1 hypothetical protein Ae201684P_021315 [Aphanomyces euteiches]
MFDFARRQLLNMFQCERNRAPWVLFMAVVMLLLLDVVVSADSTYCEVCTNAIATAALFSNKAVVNQSTFLLSKSNGRATVQEDGNFVVTNQDGTPLWATKTFGKAPANLVLQEDGNLVLYAKNGDPLWAANAGRKYKDPPYCLILQQDNTLSTWTSKCRWKWRTRRDGLSMWQS